MKINGPLHTQLIAPDFDSVSIRDANKNVIGRTYHSNRLEIDGREVGKLFAAAPEMYSALLECEALVRNYPVVHRMVIDAMKKANGI